MGSPLLIVALMVFVAVLLVCLGIGVVVGVAVLGMIGVLVSVGVVSTSVLAGLRQGSLKVGVRWAVYQVLMVVGCGAGAGVGVMIRLFMQVGVSGRVAVVLGAAAGLAAGVMVAWVGLVAVERGAKLVVEKWALRRKVEGFSVG